MKDINITFDEDLTRTPIFVKLSEFGVVSGILGIRICEKENDSPYLLIF